MRHRAHSLVEGDIVSELPFGGSVDLLGVSDGDFEAQDPGDIVLPGRGHHNFVVQVPHHPWQVRHVDVLHRVVGVALSTVHVEGHDPRARAHAVEVLATELLLAFRPTLCIISKAVVPNTAIGVCPFRRRRWTPALVLSAAPLLLGGGPRLLPGAVFSLTVKVRPSPTSARRPGSGDEGLNAVKPSSEPSKPGGSRRDEGGTCSDCGQ
mmetsp:Transcript_87/g.322  ORF Transcript_87/g.322 Transcript_87/m.322 type:complete len:208 (+) Transcript_87:542-1165(+)